MKIVSFQLRNKKSLRNSRKKMGYSISRPQTKLVTKRLEASKISQFIGASVKRYDLKQFDN